VVYAPDIGRQLDDAALVTAAQGGDRFALDQLLRRHYERVHAVCRRIAGNSRDADDACQEAMIKIVRNLPRFDGRSSFGTWAYRIATNAALDELRKRSRRPALRLVDDDDPAGAAVDPVDPRAGRRIDLVADHLLLDQALSELSEELRTAVVLRDVADLDYGDIADVLDIPLGTVKSRIARGRTAMARALDLDARNDPRHGTAEVDPGALPHEATTDGNQPPTGERPTDPT